MENKGVKDALYELSIQTDKENVYQDEINGYVGMWVWHKTNQNCVKIGKSDLTTFKDDIKKLCDNKEIYPVQMANEDKL